MARSDHERIEPSFGGSMTEAVGGVATGFVPRSLPRRRPAVISLLSATMFVSGLTLIFIPILGMRDVLAISAGVGFSEKSVLVQLFALGVVCVVGGTGAWGGRGWGWLLAQAALLFGVVAALLGLLYLYRSGMPATLFRGETISPYVKIMGRLVLHAALVAYLFRPGVLNYFDLKSSRAAALLVLAATAVSSLAVVATFFSSGGL